MSGPLTLASPRTIKLDTGERQYEHPADQFGRMRSVAKLDRRTITRRAEGDPIGFRGHAIVWNRRTWIGSRSWGFWEQIAPEAVTKTLADGADVRFLWNHDPSLLLARSTAATLRMTADGTGLLTDADMAPVSYARDLAVLLERGDISQMSFAFEPLAYRWEEADDGKDLYTITELRLFDVSVVTFPAYEETDAGLRGVTLLDAMCRQAGLGTSDVAAVAERLQSGRARGLADALAAAARRDIVVVVTDGESDDDDEIEDDCACTSCGAVCDKGDVFCATCGAKLGAGAGTPDTCPSCGACADQGDQFCSACGTVLRSKHPAPAETTRTTTPPAETTGSTVNPGDRLRDLRFAMVVRELRKEMTPHAHHS